MRNNGRSEEREGERERERRSGRQNAGPASHRTDILFYDFEVFRYDWLVVTLDMSTDTEQVIISSYSKLKAFYDAHRDFIWVGFNSRHYDQYVLKAILALGMEADGTDVSTQVAKDINDYIIVHHHDGWQYSSLLRTVPINNYDVMPTNSDEKTARCGLKTLEGFLGSDIRETEVPFDLDRKLTEKELRQTIYYCRHDVEETVKVFIERKADFEAILSIVSTFDLPLSCIGDTEARLTSKVLGCQNRRPMRDEFEYYFLPCLKLGKYDFVRQWFAEKREEAERLGVARYETFDKKAWYRKQLLSVDVAGVPHVFGFGGLHGAPAKPIHKDGQILHVDVNNYYPSLLLAHGLVTRSATNRNYARVYETRKALKYRQTHAESREEAAEYKKAQLPYKKMLNALSGSMKDETNAAYDPRNNNCMCINGQLMLLDLIGHLEAVPGFELIQSNTDGLIIRVPDTDEAFEAVDDICWEWEQRCSTDTGQIRLELHTIREIYQKDVNNYLWIDEDGGVKRIGAYIKELSSIDNDLPIINEAVVEYMVHKTPVEETIGKCDKLIEFQKIVKLSDNYKWVEHEYGGAIQRQSGVRVIKTWYEYTQTERFTSKCYRVFASNRRNDGRILKCGGKRGKPEKFANTPDHCFIDNGSMEEARCPSYLDKGWYISMAKKRLKDFGVRL